MGALVKAGIKAALGSATGGASVVATWLLEHWRLVLTVGAAITIGISFRVVLHERDTAREKVAADAKTIATLTGQKEALQANVNTLKGEIVTQNGSIDSLRKASAAAKQAASDAMQAAAKQHQKDAATIVALQARGADPSNVGSCDAEISRIRAGL